MISGGREGRRESKGRDRPDRRESDYTSGEETNREVQHTWLLPYSATSLFRYFHYSATSTIALLPLLHYFHFSATSSIPLLPLFCYFHFYNTSTILLLDYSATSTFTILPLFCYLIILLLPLIYYTSTIPLLPLFCYFHYSATLTIPLLHYSASLLFCCFPFLLLHCSTPSTPSAILLLYFIIPLLQLLPLFR